MVLLKKRINFDQEKLSIYTKHLPKNYNFEIEKILDTIKNGSYKKIALQMPDGLLKYSLIIIDTIRGMITTHDVEVILLGDVVYGACCLDDISAYELSCDLMIHFGHSCLIPLNNCRVKCLYIFVDILFDIEHAIKMIEKVADENLANDNKHIKPENTKCIHSSGEIVEKNTGFKTKNINFSYDEKTNLENKVTQINETISIYDKFRDISILGTIQFNTAINVISKRLNIHVPQIKPLSRGEILGCTSPRIKDKKIVVYIADGRFHLESVMIRNPDLKFYKYCPFMKKMTREYYEYQKMIENRKLSKEKFLKSCKKIGIILGDLGRQGNPKIFQNIIDFLKDKDFILYKIILKEINQLSLSVFSFCDAFVQVSCPRLSIDWGVNFEKPLLNPYELFNNISEYEMDYYSREVNNIWNN